MLFENHILQGRTLAGFVLENIARGRTRHIWVSVSADLFDDAKRDLSDLGLSHYARNKCHLLGNLPYSPIKIGNGLIFTTYRTLIGKSGQRSRLDQLMQWCNGAHGEDEDSGTENHNANNFDGLIMFDECHKAKNIMLDADTGQASNVGSAECSQTAAAVVELQQCLPRARVVYCSATAVSKPHNLGFMSRLGLWGYGTEHPSGFTQFLENIDRLGCGAMELHAMYLKQKGALIARTLSYAGCEFHTLDNIMTPEMHKVYNKSADLWQELYVALINEISRRKERQEFKKKLAIAAEKGSTLDRDMGRMQDIYADSDDEADYDEAEKEASEYRKSCRNRLPHVLNGVFWGAHQRFFRSLCIASKVDLAIETVQAALKDGHCCVIGLQSTGESRAKDAAKQAGMKSDEDEVLLEDFISAPQEGMLRILMNLFPLPVRKWLESSCFESS